jgi:tricorn protease
MEVKMKRVVFWSLLILTLFTATLFAGEDARLLRFPTIHGDQIVFSYAGDLYTVSDQGGIARKLTSHQGYEMFPRFSNDGKWIAFTGQYDGNTEVYLIPAEGGVPCRLTYTATLGRDDVSDRMGPNNIVMAWTGRDTRIVFRSRMHSYNPFNGALFQVNTSGDMPEQIPVPRGGFCSFSPDGRKMAYNRIFREFRTWKRYRGGMADDVWVYDLETKTIENVTQNPAQDIIPMWKGNRIYFLSDRDAYQRMNLYVLDLESRETRQLTSFQDFDIKFPAMGSSAIVFENGGYIYRFDLESEKAEKVPVTLADDQFTGRSALIKVEKRIGNYEIAPDGKRALFGARGDVFTVPAKHGPVRNLTQTSGVHERNSKWSPDGKWIAWISDATGEDEIYLISQAGLGKPVQITTGGETYKYTIYWSPDSKKILWSDRRQRLRFVDIDTKKIKEIARAEAFEIRQYSWSPDSRWVAYARPEVEGMQKIYLYSLDSGKTIEATDGWYAGSSPVFSSDGRYLLFISNRDFSPSYSWTEWNHIYRDMSRIYLIPLSRKTPSPFEPISDEVRIEGDKSSSGKNEKDDKEIRVELDVQGLKERIVGLPIQPAAYRSPASVGDQIYYIRQGSKDKKPLLMLYDLKERKETELGQINGFEISTDGKKMLVSQNGKYAVIDLPKGPVKLEKFLDLSAMEVLLNRHEEWEQVFHESWRQMREFFYAPNMHGLDWKAVYDKYRPMVDHVNHGADLGYVIGEMIGELNCGHTYITSGEKPRAERIQTGLLGARIVKDRESGYFRVKHILKGENWNKRNRSPLTEVGVTIDPGDYILAVNGRSTRPVNNIYRMLVNTVGRQVVLRVNDKPEEAGSREEVVVPIGDESDLYYMEWVQNNIKKVNEATQGKVGYIHVPDMSAQGLNEFVKMYYPQLRKKALIIDVRGNGGGNVSPMLIERLGREIAMVGIARNTVPSTDPGGLLYGPKVCLLDEFSASDGDLFPYRFKAHKLGKLVGKRSWGGVVGIRGALPLLDGSTLFKPEFAPFSVDGKSWVIEGVGVEPDIYMDNDPAKEYAGVDQQLNKAIEVILEELESREKTLPPVPPYPVKVPEPEKQ